MMLKFLLFMIYVTIIFFLPNEPKIILSIFAVNITWGLLSKIKHLKLFRQSLAVLPFLLLTFSFNAWLDSLFAASFVTMKLFLVCWATFIYSQTIGVLEFAGVIRKLLMPLEKVGLEPNDAALMVALSLSLIPIFRRDASEIKMALRAKGAGLDLRCGRLVATRMTAMAVRRVNEIDAALKAKGVA